MSKIIILIGSHIKVEKQLFHLIKTIESLRSQINYDNSKLELDVRISVSVENKKEVIIDITPDMIEKSGAKIVDITDKIDENVFIKDSKEEINIPKLTPEQNNQRVLNILNMVNINKYSITIQEKSMSLFEHYKYLAEKIDDPNCLIILGTDGDIWNPIRTGIFMKIIENIPSECNFVSYVEEKRANSAHSNYTENIQDMCIKIEFFKDFLSKSNHLQLNNDFCSDYFVRYALSYQPSVSKNKRAISNTELITYLKLEAEDTPELYSPSWKAAIRKGLDQFIAKTANPNIVKWLEFCKVDSKDIPTDLKKYLVETYLHDSKEHIFL